MDINQLLEKRKQQQGSHLVMFILSLILHGVIIISIVLLPSFSSPRYSFPKFISASLVDFPSLPGLGGGGGGEGGLPQGELSGDESEEETSPPEVKEEKKPELTFSHKDAEAPAPKLEEKPQKQAPKPVRQTEPKGKTTSQKGSRKGAQGGGNVGAIGGRIGGGAGFGGAGGGGGSLGDLDSISLELAWYQANLTNILQSNWSTSVSSPATKGLVVVVNFTILKDGTITNVEIVQGTGDFALDQAVLRAVLRSSPLPPLPWDIKKDRLIAQYEFVY